MRTRLLRRSPRTPLGWALALASALLLAGAGVTGSAAFEANAQAPPGGVAVTLAGEGWGALLVTAVPGSPDACFVRTDGAGRIFVRFASNEACDGARAPSVGSGMASGNAYQFNDLLRVTNLGAEELLVIVIAHVPPGVDARLDVASARNPGEMRAKDYGLGAAPQRLTQGESFYLGLAPKLGRLPSGSDLEASIAITALFVTAPPPLEIPPPVTPAPVPGTPPAEPGPGFPFPFQNRAPIARYTAAVAGLDVGVDAARSEDPEGLPLAFAWDWGDGTPGGTGATASHRYARGGNYVVRLTVTDVAGLTASASQLVAVNTPPTAAFAHRTQGATIEVDARGSSDPDGEDLSYHWNWGDGTPAGQGVRASHVYSRPGAYVLRLTVLDGRGGSHVAEKTVTLERFNSPPAAAFSTRVEGLLVRADASSSEDPDGPLARYLWDWGDGEASEGGPEALHRYLAPGVYVVTLTVFDERGAAASVERTVSLERPNESPVPTFRWSPLRQGNQLLVRADATGSYDSEGFIESYRWDWGDGTSSLGPVGTHVYATAGTYRVTLHVVDDAGARASTSREVTLVEDEGHLRALESASLRVDDLPGQAPRAATRTIVVGDERALPREVASGERAATPGPGGLASLAAILIVGVSCGHARTRRRRGS